MKNTTMMGACVAVEWANRTVCVAACTWAWLGCSIMTVACARSPTNVGVAEGARTGAATPGSVHLASLGSAQLGGWVPLYPARGTWAEPRLLCTGDDAILVDSSSRVFVFRGGRATEPAAGALPGALGEAAVLTASWRGEAEVGRVVLLGIDGSMLLATRGADASEWNLLPVCGERAGALVASGTGVGLVEKEDGIFAIDSVEVRDGCFASEGRQLPMTSWTVSAGTSGAVAASSGRGRGLVGLAADRRLFTVGGSLGDGGSTAWTSIADGARDLTYVRELGIAVVTADGKIIVLREDGSRLEVGLPAGGCRGGSGWWPEALDALQLAGGARLVVVLSCGEVWLGDCADDDGAWRLVGWATEGVGEAGSVPRRFCCGDGWCALATTTTFRSWRVGVQEVSDDDRRGEVFGEVQGPADHVSSSGWSSPLWLSGKGWVGAVTPEDHVVTLAEAHTLVLSDGEVAAPGEEAERRVAPVVVAGGRQALAFAGEDVDLLELGGEPGAWRIVGVAPAVAPLPSDVRRVLNGAWMEDTWLLSTDRGGGQTDLRLVGGETDWLEARLGELAMLDDGRVACSGGRCLLLARSNERGPEAQVSVVLSATWRPSGPGDGKGRRSRATPLARKFGGMAILRSFRADVASRWMMVVAAGAVVM
jgi:hypothetical protein